MNTQLQKLIVENSIPEPNSGCYLWLGSYTEDGYGYVILNGKPIKAHRVALSAFSGFSLNSSLNSLHGCNTKACVNHEHLYPGTQKQNVGDLIKSGKFHGQRYSKVKTRCPKGHHYINVDRYGKKSCYECPHKRYLKNKLKRAN